MADISATTWSETDASNNSAAPLGAPEGMPPSGVNDTMRANMGAIKRWRDSIGPALTSGGSANAQTLTNTVARAAYAVGDVYCFIAGATNTGPCTLNVDGLGAVAIQVGSGALAGGEIRAGYMVKVGYDGTHFQLGTGSWASTMVALPAFSAWVSATQSLAQGTAAHVPFDQVDFDVGSYFDHTTNHRYTPLVPGKYRIRVGVSFGQASAAAGNQVYAMVVKNGTAYRRAAVPLSGTGSQVQGCPYVEALVQLNGSTDYVEGWALSEATTPTVIGGSSGLLTYMSGEWACP